jgi:indole-3-glycerol phosphate synthase
MSVLGAILDDKRRAVAARRAEVPLEVLESKAEPSDRSFLDALRAPGLSLIAEIKHRSPSRGVLRAEVAPRAIAAIYDRYAAAISVLTDEPYFGGAPAHLAEARRGSRRPLLCKDFVVDPEYQVPEARAWGADTVLLIARVLSAPQIERGLQIARRLGMEPLVEVHQRRELEQVLGETSARIVGVNSRDLDTLAIDPGRMEELAQAPPARWSSPRAASRPRSSWGACGASPTRC